MIIGTDMTIIELTLLSATISIVFTRVRKLESSEREWRENTEKVMDDQMVNLCRIGHDLNNNFTLVKGLCENIFDDSIPHDSKLKIVNAINTLNGVLISDIMDTFRDDPTRKISKEKIDVLDLIETYIIVARGMSGLEGKSMVVSYNGMRDDIPFVYSNIERLHQIMCNLVGNAVKYTQRGCITFGIRYTEETLSIVVTDTGIGISEKDIPKLFDEFYR
ncbi:unnamed protein product [Pylaiella littoralis]